MSTLPLSLRRSTINVENVIVRLRQSRTICLRAVRPQCFFNALLAMTMGSKCVFLNSLTTPGCAHPSNGGELGTYRRGEKFSSVEGWRALRDGVVIVVIVPHPVVLCMPPAKGGEHYLHPTL